MNMEDNQPDTPGIALPPTETGLGSLTRELIQSVEEMSEAVDKNSQSVSDLSKSLARVEDRQRSQHFLILSTMCGVLVITVAFLVGFFLVQQDTNQRTHEVLCPLYATFLRFEGISQTNPNTTPEQKAETKKAYVIIHQGYNTLQCQP